MAELKETPQIKFLNQIKSIIPPEKSFTCELAELLKVSQDSIYRRLRGETAMTLDETALLCEHFRISFDAFSPKSTNINFYYDRLSDSKGFKHYLESILADMILIKNADKKEIVYAAIDIPIFHHFNSPKVSAFKMFYWMKAVMNVPALEGQRFSVKHISEELADLGKQIYEVYKQIPSVEIWTNETVNSLIKQIEFYWESGNFASAQDAIEVCEEAKVEIEILHKQAELSNKIINGTGKENNRFALYHSDIEIGNNCIYTQKGESELVYLSVHTFNKIITPDKVFVNDTKEWLRNLIKKSSLISGSSQKMRYQFFRTAITKIEKLEHKINEEG